MFRIQFQFTAHDGCGIPCWEEWPCLHLSATWQDLLLVTCNLEITDLTASLMAGAVSGVRRVSCDGFKLGGNQKE